MLVFYIFWVCFWVCLLSGYIVSYRIIKNKNRSIERFLGL